VRPALGYFQTVSCVPLIKAVDAFNAPMGMLLLQQGHAKVVQFCFRIATFAVVSTHALNVQLGTGLRPQDHVRLVVSCFQTV
jgi:hypothetical protein